MTVARTEACTRCGRRFVVVGRHGPLRCPCGGTLVESELSDGLHEVKRSRARSSTRPKASEPREHDLGYGESHGYGPAHGGPTGPGDAPAAADVSTEPAKSTGTR